jgi:FkbM family methyltransferase
MIGTEIRRGSFAGKEFSFVYWSEQTGLDPDRSNDTWWVFEDEKEVRERHWHFQPGDVVVDVGSNCGGYTLTAAVQGAEVWAFEPYKLCSNCLAANVAINPDFNVHIMRVGASDKEEEITGIDVFGPRIAGSNSFPGYHEPLKLVPLDSVLGNLDKVDMIKVDIEGAEAKMLRGAAELIKRCKPKMLIEEHIFRDPSLSQQCQEIIESWNLGYKVERVPHGAVIHAFWTIG